MIGYMSIFLIFIMQVVGVYLLHKVTALERRWLAISIAMLTLLSTVLLWSPSSYSEVFADHFELNPQKMLLASAIQIGTISIVLSSRKSEIQSSILPWMLIVLLFETLSIVVDEPVAIIGFSIISTAVAGVYIRQFSRAYFLYSMVTIALLAVACVGFLMAEPPTWAIVGIILASMMKLGIFPFSSGTLALCERTGFSIPAMISLLPMSGVALFFIDQPILQEGSPIEQVLLYWLSGTALVSTLLALRQTILAKSLHYAFGGMESILLLAILISHNSTATFLLWVNLLLSTLGIVGIFHILQSRVGRIGLGSYNGLSHISPILGVYFLFMLGAYAAFPGFLGFVSLDGFLHSVGIKYIGILFIIVATIIMVGFALMRIYFKVFLGKENFASNMPLNGKENLGIFILCLLLMMFGLFPSVLLA